jgi:hypothetical protein
MTRPRAQRLVDLGAVLALVGLALVVWSVVDPTPLAVVLAMTAGQVVGTASLALLVAGIVVDLRRAQVLSRKGGEKQ